MVSMQGIVVLTGAGVSAESGLKTFRDDDGLWEGHRVEEVATPEAFKRNPELVHHFYNLRRNRLREVAPNPAHQALARLEEMLGDRFLLVTQNVDDLHERAGSRRLLHMHGELLKMRCGLCGVVSECSHDLAGSARCGSCGGVGGMRPHIVWFGEMPLYLEEIDRALRHAALFVAIGTSGHVYPAAGFIHTAQAAGARTLEFNLAETALTDAFDESVVGPAAETVPRWVEKVDW